MKLLPVVAMSIGLAAILSCAQTTSVSIPYAAGHAPSGATFPTGSVPARTDFGAHTLEALRKRYADSATNCGDNEKPAILCSGVLVRGTDFSSAYHAWNPSPASVTRGGVSFSYIRHDANFIVSSYGSGFTFSPVDHTPWATNLPTSLCSFPRNAATASRADKGCGLSGSLAVSAPCQPQNVLTDTQWRVHFANQAGSNDGAQCGFTITPGPAGGAAAGFMASVNARLIAPPITSHNEVVVATWPQNIGASIPLESFIYYTNKDASALIGAQNNQRDLLNTDGVAVPVIRATLPADATGQTTFAFEPADQVIQAPSLPGSLELAPAVPLAPLGALRLQDVLDHPTIEVHVPPLPGIQAGDTARVRWMGPDTLYETPAQPLTAGSATVFPVPRGSVLATLGQSVAVSFVVTSGISAAIERTSLVYVITVQGQAMTLPPPVVAGDHRYVTIDYPGMAGRDRVLMTYEGGSSHEVPHLVGTPGPFTIGLPPDWLAGPPGRIHYTVQPDGQSTRYVSPTAVVGVRPLPVMRDAPNGWLDHAELTTDPAVAVRPWEGIALGRLVWLDALAYSPDGSEQQTVLLDGVTVDATILREGIRATLPRAWLSRLPDGSAVLLRARTTLQGSDLAQAVAFPVARVTLRGAPGPMVTKPLVRLVERHADGTVMPIEAMLSRSALQGELQVRVAPWPGMATGQRLWLRLRGRQPGGVEAVIDLVVNGEVAAADLNDGLIKPVPIGELALLADGSPLTVELKVGFEKLTEEARALRFPVNHMAYGK